MDPWRAEETRALLMIWSEDEIQRELDVFKRNQKVFMKISERMRELGYTRRADQCRLKIKKLKQDYRRLKDQNNRGGSGRRTNCWFEALDAVLGHRPAHSGSGSNTAESVTSVLLDSTCSAVCKEEPDPEPLSDDGRRTPVPESSEDSVVHDETTTSPITGEIIRGKRKRKHTDTITAISQMWTMAQDREDDREDRRQRMQRELEEQRIQALIDIERSAAARETELIRTLSDFNQGLLSVLGQLVQVMSNNRSHS